jgi:hypothetical protein
MRRLRPGDGTVGRSDRRGRRSRSGFRLDRFVRLSRRGRGRRRAGRPRRGGRRGSGLRHERLVLCGRDRRGHRRHRRRRVRVNRRYGDGRGRRRGGRRRRPRREERERIEVPVLVAREADPEMDVRLVDLRAARADAGDGRSLLHACSATRLQRSEMRQRDAVAVERSNAEREPVAGRRPCERDLAAHGRCDGAPGHACDIDPSMLPRQLRLRTVEREGPQHGSVRRPRPRERRTRHGESDHGCDG